VVSNVNIGSHQLISTTGVVDSAQPVGANVVPVAAHGRLLLTRGGYGWDEAVLMAMLLAFCLQKENKGFAIERFQRRHLK
jgi:hypothetical protein